MAQTGMEDVDFSNWMSEWEVVVGGFFISAGVVSLPALLFQCRCALVGCAVDPSATFLPERLLAFLYWSLLQAYSL